MGNDASKNLKRAMTIKRGGRGSDSGDEYSAIDIREKYERMPKVSVEERMIIKSSWRIIQNKVIARVCEFVMIWDYKTYRNISYVYILSVVYLFQKLNFDGAWS